MATEVMSQKAIRMLKLDSGQEAKASIVRGAAKKAKMIKAGKKRRIVLGVTSPGEEKP